MQDPAQAPGTTDQLEGEVRACLPNTLFRVALENGHEVTAHIAPSLRGHYSRLLVGDRVLVQITASDLGRARILQRR
jgi:translation initiation factor IF-1